jgi:D-alanyl-D-alanine carboxypeptidase (penicillin-binding protein 5/6)
VRPRHARRAAGRAGGLLVAALLLATSPGVTPVLAEPVGPPPAGVTGLGVASGLSVVLVEVATGQVLLARDAEVRRPVASAIKLVTALTVVEQLPAGSIVEIGPEVIGLEGSSYDLRPGEVRSVEDLLAGLLLRSGNDAAVALAVATAGTEEAFVGLMGATLARLGVEGLPGSSSGLDAADALTALELAAVARAALSEPRISAMLATPILALPDGSLVENRNLFLGDMPDATGLKTGFTSAAGYTLAASARRDGRDLVAVVLGAADDLERRAVAARLLEHGYVATRRVDVDRSVTLRTARGPVRFATTRTSVTVDAGSSILAAWPVSLRPDDELQAVVLRAGDAEAGVVAVERLDGRRSPERITLGRALADGVYAALRPTGLAGTAEGPDTALR